jgi:LemA protein
MRGGSRGANNSGSAFFSLKNSKKTTDKTGRGDRTMESLMVPLVALVGVSLFFLVVVYNTLVRRRNAVEQARGSIAAQLKQRFDLIPGLVETAQAFMKHERAVLEKLTELRTRAMSGGLSGDLQALDKESRGALKGLFVAAEAYPQLTSSQAFVQIQHSLRDVEAELAAARRAYNSAVTDLNNSVETFPSNLIAGSMGFRRGEVFQVPPEESGPMKIKDLFGKAS